MDIGIDLGTTYSVIAVNGQIRLKAEYGEGIYIKECDVTIIPTPYGEQSFPSVAIEDPANPGNLLFGTDALSVADEDCPPIMFSKRKIGSDEILTTGTVKMTAMGFATAFLAYLKHCAEQALETKVTRAVVTHPAYFDRIAVEQTREAAISAGFEMSLVDQMVMEPVAAALAYTRTDKRDPLNILTYDLGGGTFDVTVLQRSSGILNMRAFDGDPLLGGYNFDRELVDWVRKQLKTRGRTIEVDMSSDKGKAAVSGLLRAAETVKIELAKATDDKKMIEFRARGVVKDIDGKDVPINERLSRNDFVQLISHYLERTTNSCRQALNKAEIKPKDIHEVILAGGSSYAPWIIEAIKPLFPKINPKLFLPDLCVGIGAAIHADIILPKQSTIDEYIIQMEVPERTTIESVNILGCIKCERVESLLDAVMILKSSDGRKLDETGFDSELRFNFSDIELMVLEGDNNYLIEIIDANNKLIFSHPFCIKHETKGSDASTVTTVLPKPMFIETYDGLVPIAKEGVALPARISQTFQRLNDNPNFEILLYQNDEKTGVIRVENIPLEGGKGAFLDLDLQITQKNEIKGKAIIRNDDIGFKTERVISVSYNVQKIPDSAELLQEINQLRAKINELSKRKMGTEDSTLLSESILTANKLLDESEKLFKRIPLERNEVYALLKEVGRILEPPRDDMNPSRKEFYGLIEYCRNTCTKLIESTKEIAGEDKAGQGIDRSMVDTAGITNRKAKEILKRIEDIERKGIEAANKKDRRNWLMIHDKLKKIIGELQKDDKLKTPPTIYNKLLAKREIMVMFKKLLDACDQIESDGKLQDWESELRSIHDHLMNALLEIHDLDDSSKAEETLHSIRGIYHKNIITSDIAGRVNRIGINIKTVR